MRIWLTGNDIEIRSYLSDALDGILPPPIPIDAEALLETPDRVAGTLVLAGYHEFTDQVRHLFERFSELIANGDLLLFLNLEKNLPPRAFPMSSLTPLALKYLVETTIEHIQLKGRLSQVETERDAARRIGTELMSGMAHDLRAPLNSIVGFSELLEEHAFGPLNEKQTRYAANIGASGKALLNLIDDITDFAKIDSERVGLEMEPVDITELLNDSIRLVRERAQKRGVSLAWEPAGQDSRSVRVDRRRFRQAIYLLLSSQIESRNSGARVSISVVGDESNVCLRFELEPESGTPPPETRKSELLRLAGWQEKYIEQVLELHGAVVVGWGKGAHANGRMEIRLPGSL